MLNNLIVRISGFSDGIAYLYDGDGPNALMSGTTETMNKVLGLVRAYDGTFDLLDIIAYTGGIFIYPEGKLFILCMLEAQQNKNKEDGVCPTCLGTRMGVEMFSDCEACKNRS